MSARSQYPTRILYCLRETLSSLRRGGRRVRCLLYKPTKTLEAESTRQTKYFIGRIMVRHVPLTVLHKQRKITSYMRTYKKASPVAIFPLHSFPMVIKTARRISDTRFKFRRRFNTLHRKIRMHILDNVLYTFPRVLTGRICMIIKSFFSW